MKIAVSGLNFSVLGGLSTQSAEPSTLRKRKIESDKEKTRLLGYVLITNCNARTHKLSFLQHKTIVDEKRRPYLSSYPSSEKGLGDVYLKMDSEMSTCAWARKSV